MTYAQTMASWEQLHLPFLADADAQTDLLRKMDGYRKAIAVDYACELAHQKLSATARDHARAIRQPGFNTKKRRDERHEEETLG